MVLSGVRAFKRFIRSFLPLVLVGALLFRRNASPIRKLFVVDQKHGYEASKNIDTLTKKEGKTIVSVPYVDREQRYQNLARVQQQSQEQPEQGVPPAVQAPQRSQRKRKKQQTIKLKNVNTDELNLPPLDSLIGDTYENVTGDVQFLLDFAIVGFGKCGTTALIDWLDSHPEINTIEKEALHLSRHRPANMVQKLYEMKVESLVRNASSNRTNTNTIMKDRIQGFKNPSDVRRPESMVYLRQHWPQTKLIITVRHPVEWFRSLYNFLVNEMGRSQKYLHANPLIGGPHKNTAYAHTGKGEFHAILSLLGKTEMIEEEELELLKGFLQEDEILDWPQRLPNKIFFLETTQMADTNETRAALFRNDLQTFLGLHQELPPVLHVRPGRDRNVGGKKDVKIDMCSPENDPIRKELMRISEKASLWIRKYFLDSPDVFVSSRDYLEEIFATSWMQDPCETTHTREEVA